MHSPARGSAPRTPQASHPGPMSVQDSLPTQLLFLLALVSTWLGQAPGATHWPLQTTEGALHAHVVGFTGGEAVNPSMHLNPQGFPLVQSGVLWSGYLQFAERELRQTLARTSRRWGAGSRESREDAQTPRSRLRTGRTQKRRML